MPNALTVPLDRSAVVCPFLQLYTRAAVGKDRATMPFLALPTELQLVVARRLDVRDRLALSYVLCGEPEGCSPVCTSRG